MKVGNSRLLVFDLETTGIDPVKNDILSMGIVVLENWNIVHEEELKLKFTEGLVTAEALGVNKIDLRSWNQQSDIIPSPASFLTRLFSLVDKWFPRYIPAGANGELAAVQYVPIAGHNLVGFDVPFLRNFIDVKTRHLHQTRYEDIFSYRCMDTMQAAFFLGELGLIKPTGYNLKALLDYFGVEADTNRLHGALYDAVLEAKLLIKMRERFSLWGGV